MPKNTCNICLENVLRPARLNLTCECKYYVHYKCFNTWYKHNQNCIICHKFCYEPDKYRRRNTTPVRKSHLIKKIEYRQSGRRIYPIQTRYIQNNHTRIRCCFYHIPPDYRDENYCKTMFGICLFSIGIGIWVYINGGI